MSDIWTCPRCGETAYAWIAFCKDCAAAADDEQEHQDHIRDGKPTWHKCFTCVWNRYDKLRIAKGRITHVVRLANRI